MSNMANNLSPSTFSAAWLQGCITALVTPFDANGVFDRAAWLQLLELQIAANVAGVVVAGSTGESVALSDAEFDELLSSAVKFAHDHPKSDGSRIAIMAGTGTPSTFKTQTLNQRAAHLGADAALVVAPAYVRATAEGLYAHYSSLATHAPLPLILYNVPARTSCDLTPSIVERLYQHPKIIGIKEALPDPARMQELLSLQNPDFVVLSGDDPTALAAFQMGARGIVSVASNVLPKAMQALWNFSLSDPLQAKTLQKSLEPLFDALGAEPNPTPIKYALAEFNLISGGLRLPLLPLSAEHRPALNRVLSALEHWR